MARRSCPALGNIFPLIGFKGIYMTQTELEEKILRFLKGEKGFVTDAQISQWKLMQGISSDLSVDDALDSLKKQGFISLKDNGIIVH